jgi:hypothetical protein
LKLALKFQFPFLIHNYLAQTGGSYEHRQRSTASLESLLPIRFFMPAGFEFGPGA